MRPRTIATAAVLTLTVSVGTTVAGLSRSGGGPFAAPAAAAAELEPFAGCPELLDWYVEKALPRVGPYGLEPDLGSLPEPMVASGGAEIEAGSGRSGAVDVAEAAPQAAAASSGTGTNVQEGGVDEPDRAKTDGRLVVHVADGTLLVTDVSGDSPRPLGRLRLPDDLGPAELLLAGDTVLVLGTPEADLWWGGPDARMAFPAGGTPETTRLLEISVADPEAPTVVSDRTFGGALLSARQYAEDGGAGTVRLVLGTGTPTLDFVTPHRDRTEEEATEANRRIVRESTVADWLPSVRARDGRRSPLVACEDVLHPSAAAGLGTVTVVSLPGGDPAAHDAVAVTAAGETVYSSVDRLYLAETPDGRSTDVHAFTLDGSRTAYTASGTVPGTVKDRWSMDERDGVLRLAVAHAKRWLPVDNAVVTLREAGRTLVELGSVRGLGPGEEIKAVRWFDDLAVVVTFRQTDPVYTVDLTDPATPRTLGELKIPGFSEYLHPVGGDRLLGVGVDATLEGRVRGGQVSTFDISDLARPARVDALGLGHDQLPGAGLDPRALTWLSTEPGTGTALTTTSRTLWRTAGPVARLVELRVLPDGSLELGRTWPLGWPAESVRALPLGQGRVAVVGAQVRLVAVAA